MSARIAWMGGLTALTLLAAMGGCRGLAGVEDAYLIDDAGPGGSSQGGGAGSSNGGTAGSAEGGTGQGGTGEGGTGQGGTAGSCGNLTNCDGQCVDTSMDRNHCGGCKKACDDDQVCSASMCMSCAPNTPCGSDCVDLGTDQKHCGACDKPCAANEQCVSGQCQPCPTGQFFCSGACVDLDTNASHCGWCDHSCGGQCNQGVCPAETMVQTEGSPSSLAADGSVVYWTDVLLDDPWGKVLSSSYPGDMVTIIDSAGTSPLALSVETTGYGRLVWASKEGAAWSLRGADAQSKTEKFKFGIDGDVFQSIIHQGAIFWTKNGGTSVQRLDIDGKGPPAVLSNALTMPFGLVGHDIFIYAADEAEIVRLNANAPGSAYPFALDQHRPRFIARAGDRIVWDNTDPPDIRMRRVDLSGSQDGDIVCSGFDNLKALVAIEDVIYFAAHSVSLDRDAIFAVRALPQSVARPLAWTSTTVTSMAVDGSYVYWGGLDKTIMRVPRGSTPP